MNPSADCTMLFAGGSGSSWRKWIAALCLLLANIAMLVLLLALRPILLSNPLSTMNLTSTSNASEWPSLALNYSIIPETKTSLATCAAAAVKRYSSYLPNSQERDAILWATAVGDVELLSIMVDDQGVDVMSIENAFGWTLLHIAAGRGQQHVLALLITWGAPIEAHTQGKTTPLHWTAEGGHVPALEVLLIAGANLEAKDHGLRTALHHAARLCQVDAVRYLLAWGADPTAVDREGRTAGQLVGTGWTFSNIQTPRKQRRIMLLQRILLAACSLYQNKKQPMCSDYCACKR